MLNLSQKQIDDRYDSLPEILKDALWSVATADEIDRISNSHHLEDKKASRMAKITGYVIMGFLHPDDLRRELQEVLGIDIRVAASLSRDINKKILSPIIEDIRKVYTPIVSEIRKTPASSQIWPMPPVGEALKKEAEGTKIPVEELKKPAPSQTPSPLSPAPIFPPAPAGLPGPFILHKEESLKPILETRKPATESAFFKSLPQDAGFQKPAGAKLEFGAPIKPFGETHGKPIEPKVEPKQEKPKEEIPRIVNYSGLRTPLTQPPTTSKQQPAPSLLTTPPRIPQKPSIPPQPIISSKIEPQKTAVPISQKLPSPPPTLPVQKQETTPQPSALKLPASQPLTQEKKPEATGEKVVDLRSFKIIDR